MKSEPSEYSIDDLEMDGRTHWDGIRNYQARNYMRDEMKVGDLVLFYHSNCAEPGVVGLATVASAPYPDETQFDAKSEYFDPKATKAAPRWMLIEVKWKADFKKLVPLPVLKTDPSLDGLLATRPGNRLSITPVTPEHTARILALGGL